MSGNKKDGPSWTGTWLSGARAAGADLGYPGEKLGLPETGKGSVASYAKRLIALLIDWFASMLISAALMNALDWSSKSRSLATLGIFVLQAWLGTALAGATLGKLICRLRVVRLDGRPVGFGWSLARSLMLALVIPALIWDRDHRGLHDRAANTVVLQG